MAEQERARAKLLGYKDPINADYEATSAMYHSVLDECLTRWGSSDTVMVHGYVVKNHVHMHIHILEYRMK